LSFLNELSNSGNEDGNVPSFFTKLENGHVETIAYWKQYLGYLAIIVGDLRVLYDCNIVIGGYVGGFLKPHITDLKESVLKDLLLDADA